MEQLTLAYMDARSDAILINYCLFPVLSLDFFVFIRFGMEMENVPAVIPYYCFTKTGLMLEKYVSFEEQINNYKVYYYESLRKSSIDWGKMKIHIFHLLKNFPVNALYVL